MNSDGVVLNFDTDTRASVPIDFILFNPCHAIDGKRGDSILQVMSDVFNRVECQIA